MENGQASHMLGWRLVIASSILLRISFPMDLGLYLSVVIGVFTTNSRTSRKVIPVYRLFWIKRLLGSES